MKKEYEALEIEIKKFDLVDVMAFSESFEDGGINDDSDDI